jgi:hypothetical protein
MLVIRQLTRPMQKAQPIKRANLPHFPTTFCRPFVSLFQRSAFRCRHFLGTFCGGGGGYMDVGHAVS